MGKNDRDKGATLFTRIPEQHKQGLKEVAESMGLTVSAVARFAIKQYLYGVDVPGSAAVLAAGDGGESEA